MKSISARETAPWNERALAHAATGVAITVMFTVSLVFVKQFVELRDLRMPGHSGVMWMALLLLNRRYGMGRGAGTIMGAGSGILTWALFSPGLSAGAGLGLVIRYLVPGVAVDLLYSAPRRAWQSALRWAAMGAAGNLMKFAVLAAAKTLTGTFSFALLFGKWPAMGTHILFGALGGLGAWAAIHGISKARKEHP